MGFNSAFKALKTTRMMNSQHSANTMHNIVP